MSLSDKQIYDLNRINVGSQRAALGDLLEELIENGGGGGGGTGKKIFRLYPSYLNFPNVGDEDVIYGDIDANKLYRWDNQNLKYYIVGSDYTDITIINGGRANG